MDGHSLWAEEPADIPRLTEDVPNRSKRMKTLGNAVSPPQVFPILKYIADIETGRCQRAAVRWEVKNFERIAGESQSHPDHDP